jgi:hypothetical protein
MGICIHYKGRLKTENALPKMIDEVKDIAEIHNWTYHIFEREFPENHFGKKALSTAMYGICFSPPDCEPVQLTFLSNGEMRSPWSLKSDDFEEDEQDIINTLFTKTHYAGPAIHKLIIHLFDYLNGKYFSDFELYDEAQYWETKDEKLMYKNFHTLDKLINAVGDSLESNSMIPGETFEEYILRIAKEIHQQKENDK